jgi:Cu-Zn family superoxide dismutase
MKGITAAIVLLAGVFLVAFSAQGAPKGEPGKETSTKNGKAIAVLQPTEGNKARGAVKFTREKKGIKVSVLVEGLTRGPYDLRIDKSGDCSAPDGESAGGQPGPGVPAYRKRDVGDLGNIEANVYGNVYYEGVYRTLALDGHDSIIGRAVIVYAHPGDLKTKPADGAGSRVACGVISIDEK